LAVEGGVKEGLLDELIIYTVVDNEVYRNGFRSDWGLSFYIEARKEGEVKRLLMDVSGSSEAFFWNTKMLGLNLETVGSVFISHWHWDHAGILIDVLKAIGRPVNVYAPCRNEEVERELEGTGSSLIICDKPIKIFEGAYSSGKLKGVIDEHALILHLRDKGLVILVGCTHPGIENVVERSMKVTGVNKVFAVIGGLHLSTKEEGEEVGQYLMEKGVRFVSPIHCTDASARRAIEKVLGSERILRGGSGRVLRIGKDVG